MKIKILVLSSLLLTATASAQSDTSDTMVQPTIADAHGTVTFSGRIVSDPADARANCLTNAIAHNQTGRCNSHSGSVIQSSIQDLNNGNTTHGVRSRLVTLDYK